MQRVRIGLTGLAFVFVLVLLATVVIRPSAEAPLTANQVEQPQTLPAANRSVGVEPKEPLAELGVAPGNAEPNNTSTPNPSGSAPEGQ